MATSVVNPVANFTLIKEHKLLPRAKLSNGAHGGGHARLGSRRPVQIGANRVQRNPTRSHSGGISRASAEDAPSATVNNGTEQALAAQVRELQYQLDELARTTPKDKRVLPKRIVLVRHGESKGNIDET
eukprot:1187488-Prorocentrum_minimum.AAC.1